MTVKEPINRKKDKDRLDLLQKLVIIILVSVIMAGAGNVGLSAWGITKDGEQDTKIALVNQKVDGIEESIDDLVTVIQEDKEDLKKYREEEQKQREEEQKQRKAEHRAYIKALERITK